MKTNFDINFKARISGYSISKYPRACQVFGPGHSLCVHPLPGDLHVLLRRGSHSEVLPLDETHGVGEVPASGDHFLLQQGEGHGYEDEAEDEVDVACHALHLTLCVVFEQRPAIEMNKN